MPRPTRATRRALAALGVAVIAVALPVLAPSLGQAHGVARVADSSTGATAATPASDDPNNYTCAGHIQKGVAESGVSGTQVKYQFSCDGPISGYQLETEPHEIQYFDQSPVVALKGVVSSVDNFSCNGFVPGLQVNCTGQASAAFEVITGQFTIPGKNSLCKEPRVDPILTVTYAAATATLGGTKAAPTATATVTQYISGPYDLGRPWSCKGDQFGADTRLGARPPKVALAAKS
ncbi:MAG TPA: hypothetical protein VKS25_08505 [Solirubrobacteraceae bacterium]|nr:hypothetical protein [Solirubrobacteraceae bacterium]